MNRSYAFPPEDDHGVWVADPNDFGHLLNQIVHVARWTTEMLVLGQDVHWMRGPMRLHDQLALIAHDAVWEVVGEDAWRVEAENPDIIRIDIPPEFAGRDMSPRFAAELVAYHASREIVARGVCGAHYVAFTVDDDDGLDYDHTLTNDPEWNDDDG